MTFLERFYPLTHAGSAGDVAQCKDRFLMNNMVLYGM